MVSVIVGGVILIGLGYIFHLYRARHAALRLEVKELLTDGMKKIHMLTSQEVKQMAEEANNSNIKEELLRLAADLEILSREGAIAWNYAVNVGFETRGIKTVTAIDWNINKGKLCALLGKEAPYVFMLIKVYMRNLLIASVNQDESEIKARGAVIDILKEIKSIKERRGSPDDVAVMEQQLKRSLA